MGVDMSYFHENNKEWGVACAVLWNLHFNKKVYHSFSKGIIRGFHYHFKEIKMFYIIKGAAKFVAINPKNPEARKIEDHPDAWQKAYKIHLKQP